MNKINKGYKHLDGNVIVIYDKDEAEYLTRQLNVLMREFKRQDNVLDDRKIVYRLELKLEEVTRE